MAAKTSTPIKRVGRGEHVIKDVLAATRVELARVGYRALRIEDVAVRAHVHKTTIYRRWPDKVDLVQEALVSMFQDDFTLPNTGSLRGDLLAIARRMVDFMTSSSGRCLVRMMMTEGTERDLRRIVEAIRVAKEEAPKELVAAARARGELREGIDGERLISTLVGALQHQLFAMCLPLKTVDVEGLVDLILYGAMPRETPVRPAVEGGVGAQAKVAALPRRAKA